MKDSFSLQGRTALVTGGSRGIGRMITEGFLAQGAKVYISARKAAACISTASELSRRGCECIALPHDISTLEGANALAADVCRLESGRLDILVNNAGTAWGSEFDDVTEASWDKVVDLNLKTPFFLTQRLHQALKAAATPDKPSKVINISSIDAIALNSLETYSYHASKAALIHLSRRLAARLVHEHILVNAIAPGAFASDMNRFARDQPDMLATHIPSGRIGRGEDIASAAIYLAARSGDYVVGSTLVVDGGVALARLPEATFST
jgi:NAD(P)-dependent dehydrogenase (short-subunit alcohol dehydrogenase family)